MKGKRVLPLALALALALAWLCPSAGRTAQSTDEVRVPSPELAPGIRIERADPGPAAERRRRLAAWRELYMKRLGPLREESDGLFGALESSSLAASVAHCERLAGKAREVDRRSLFSSPDVRIDRVLFGSLERFVAGAARCAAGRYLEAYTLLHEARAGLRWIDHRIARGLRPPVPLAGLGD
jgi:hypothetical protein